jgi:Ser-tRNA(Ala) deacylase AlaX
MSKIYSYEREPYRRELETEILEVGEEEGRPYAVLDDTILYPEGGGQPADGGRLNGVEVTDVQRHGEEVRHYLAAPAAPGSGKLKLDWERRYDHMQQHTAQHVLSAVALGSWGWATTSFHLGPEVSDIEVDTEAPSAEELDALEEAVMAEVRSGRPVYGRRLSLEEYQGLEEVRRRGLPADHTGHVRLVEIEGVDLNTCGGTHLASTAEIGVVKLLGTEAVRGGCRLYWVAGWRVRRRLAEHEARNAELRALFETGDADLVEVATLKLEQLEEVRRRERHLQGRLAAAVVESLLARDEVAVEAHFDGADGGLLQQLARELSKRGGRKVVLLTAGGDKGAFFALAAGEEAAVDLQVMGPKVAELLDGRGGGKGQVFQGKADSLEHRDEALKFLRSQVGI